MREAAPRSGTARPDARLRRPAPLLLSLAALLWLHPGAAAALDAAATLEQGRQVYQRHCQVCHGAEGKGDGPEAPFLSPRPSSLVSAGTSTKSDADLLAVIEQGKPRTAMPGYQQALSEDDRRAVLAYIRSLIRFHQSLTPPPPS